MGQRNRHALYLSIAWSVSEVTKLHFHRSCDSLISSNAPEHCFEALVCQKLKTCVDTWCRSTHPYKLAFGSCLTGATKIKSKEISMKVKETIIKLKKQHKSIREIAKTLDVARSTVGYTLKGHKPMRKVLHFAAFQSSSLVKYEFTSLEAVWPTADSYVTAWPCSWI